MFIYTIWFLQTLPAKINTKQEHINVKKPSALHSPVALGGCWFTLETDGPL